MSAPLLLPTWEQLGARPQIVDTMRRYLEQIACVLRPGSVNNADQALRAFASFLLETAPEVTSTAQVTRRHIENFKPWLAKRPGQNKIRLTTATVAQRLGTLRMFFVRIEEWDWQEAPPRVPMFPGDLPRHDHPLPKALDDAAAAQVHGAVAGFSEGKLFVSAEADQFMVGHAQCSYYQELLDAGVKIYLYPAPWILHSKHFSVDDEVVVIGSSNMDMRSFSLNYEVVMMLVGGDLVARMRAAEDNDRSLSQLLSADEWRARSRSSRFVDNLMRLTAALH